MVHTSFISYQKETVIAALDFIAEQKQHIRQLKLQARRQLSVDERRQFSAAVIDNIKRSSVWHQAQHIGIYLAINAEVDLDTLSQHNKSLYIPATQDHRMQFHRYDAQTQLQTGPFQITQPEFKPEYVEPHLDLCLLPLVAFNRKGHRLGMGGGFYDRYFANNRQTVLAGVAFAVQEQPQLPLEDWDVKLQHIFTEQEHISS
ncbi:5-formyltetrahydrofolate cyclo-ligase [Marinicella sp. W31]|uniref:5-formyltetrahydrofolate cyclo-ligase n=1 Tax=Marinicella sp. W31 TaxID=3023713 RepID=UPI00375704FC